MIAMIIMAGAEDIEPCETPSLCPRKRPVSSFSFGVSAFGVRRSAFGVRRSAFGVRRSAFGVRRSAFGVRRSAFGVGVWRSAGATYLTPKTRSNHRTPIRRHAHAPIRVPPGARERVP